MIKRFVTRLLIVLQIYGNLFQGVAHSADLADSYPIRNQIHLQSSVDEHGGLRLRLGTDGINNPTKLKWFDIPVDALKYRPKRSLSGSWNSTEIDSDSLSQHSSDGFSTDAEEEGGVELTGSSSSFQEAYFTLQGLRFSVGTTGEMIIKGRQSGGKTPIFLSGAKSVVLSGIDANSLNITSPRVGIRGLSKINYLKLEGVSGVDAEASLVNTGELNAKQLFLNNLKAKNSGVMTSDEISLTGGAFLKFTLDSRADIKNLFLSKGSGFKNHETTNAVNIDLLASSGGSITNLGSLIIGRVGLDLDSSFKALINRQFISFGEGQVKVRHFENSGTWVGEKSSLSVLDGENSGKLQSTRLHVSKSFTNIDTGSIKTAVVSGDGELINQGTIETDGDLELDVKQLNNQGLVTAQTITGSKTLNKLSNTETAKLNAGESLSFADLTQVINHGSLKAKLMTLVGRQTTQRGDITAVTLSLTGDYPFENYGEIDAEHLRATTELINYGQLITHQSTSLGREKNSLTIANGGFAALKSLRVNGGEITNQGRLKVIGVQPECDVIKLTNSGKASIDGEQLLPRSGEDDPQNLARVPTEIRSSSSEHFLDYLEGKDSDLLRIMMSGSMSMTMSKAMIRTQEMNEGSQNRLNLIKAYEKLFSYIDKGTFEEQAKIRYRLKEFEPDYLTIKKQWIDYVTTAAGAGTRAGFAVDHSTLAPIRLSLVNQLTGQLTLKSGHFAFNESTSFLNDGTLFQEQAYLQWMKRVTGEFNRGTWNVKGSLGLLEYNGRDVGKLIVEDTLHVDVYGEALSVLSRLDQAQARKVILQAPGLQTHPTHKRVSYQYPWPLEMNITWGIDNDADISAPQLNIYSQSLKTSGNIFSNEAVLGLFVAGDAEIKASVGGQAGINLRASKLKVLGRERIIGATEPNILFKRNENGLYAQGPVILNIADLVDNQYGIIQGSSYTITASQLINLAGLITATDPSLSSTIKVEELKNLRDEQRSYLVNGKCGGHASMNISAKNRNNYNNLMWCDGGCNRQNTTYETSDEGVIFAQGDLTLNYHQLEMLVSRITSGGKLTLISGDKQLAYENAPDIQVFPGTTTMTKRNGHVNHVVAKQDLQGELGNANMATSMQGQNIFINAGMLTLQSLGVQNQSQGKIVNLLSLMQGNSFKKIGGGDSSDYTDLTLPFKHQSLPTSLVILGQDARSQLIQNQGNADNQSIDLQATMRSLEQAMGSQFYTLYRGIDGLGLDINQFFKATSDFVSGHKDTVTQRRSIKSGEVEQELEVQFNPTLTSQDLLDSGILGVFLDFTKNILALESEKKALDNIRQTTQKSALMFTVPADARKNQGVNSPGDVALVSKSDLGVFTNVKGKNVKLVSTDGSTTVGSETIRHQWGENYHDQLVRTRIEAEDYLSIQGHKDVIFRAIETESGLKTNIASKTGTVVDLSLATVNHNVYHTSDKNSETTTKITNVHQNVSSHRSGKDEVGGEVNILAETGMLFQGTKLVNANLMAPTIIQDDVHDQRMVESHTVIHKESGGFGRFIGIKERKEIHFNSNSSISKGCDNSGAKFIAMAKERFKAVNPTFRAKHNEITADEIELKVGTNTHQSQTQSSYQGPIWNKVSQSTENHITHRNPTFEHNIYLHSPKVILERVRGSMGTFDKIISDSELIFKDVDNVHQFTHKSQKSLSPGAALILSLVVSLATANPGFAASSIPAAMLSAGYGTLCSQAAICLVEKDGNPKKAMDELGRHDIGKTMFKSMATAGLTKGVGQLVGVNNGLGFDNLAKKYLVESAVNTVMAVSIDGQNFEKAMNQGITSAAVNTLTAYVAGKIGDARSQSKGANRISSTTHKGLHEILGALGGGAHSVLAGGKFKDGLLPGAIGGMGETFAELTGSKQLGDLCATTLALLLNQDPTIAYKTSSIATEHNWKKHQPHPSIMGLIKECTEEDCDEEAEVEKEAPKRSQKQEADERHRAKHKEAVVRFFTKSLSPTRPTWGQIEVAEPVKKFIGSMVPDNIKKTIKQTGESLGKKAEKSSNAWQDFKQNPSMDSWSTKHTLRHGAFETLGALGTGVEYVKAYGRRGLRGMGMDANTAQDTMSVLDGLTMLAGGTKAVTSLGTLSKQTLVSGTKLTNKLSEMTKGGGPKIKAYVKDQFNYREHFAAEQLRLEGGGLNLPKAGKYFDAEDALGLKPLSTEQPWVVRAGQEWKTKVFGKGQNTQTEGHAFRSYREAIDAAKREDVEAVFLNRGIRKVTKHPIEKPNTRPDVTIRRTDGKIDQIEVPSKTDDFDILKQRMKDTNGRLPEHMQGEQFLKGITKIKDISK